MCDETQERQTRQPRRDRRALARSRKKAAGSSGAALASGAALTLGVAMAAAPAAQAATFTVINLNDSGAGSLRQAIEDANAAAGADVVDFQAGLTGTITLTSGQLAITDSVDVQGPGAAVLTVSGNNASRVFYLYNGSALLDVTLSGLTITGGSDTIGAGVVDFDENLVLDGVTITGNTASSDGGGIWADGFNMNLTIRDSTISGNTSGDDGGGMYVEDTGGPLLIQSSVFSGNDAAGAGGGIYFYDPDNDVTIDQSTISGNTAGTLGGGVYLYSPDAGVFTIQGSTISGNSAPAGGGAFLYSPDHGFVMENSTISGNQATAGNGGGIYFYNLYDATVRHTTVAGNSASGTGGGMFINNSPLTVEHTIVGDNTAPTDADLATGTEGSFELAFSLVENPGTASITDNGGNVFSQDPQLGPLANNGGPTQTHLPALTSPAVNAGDPAFAPPPATDQRGLPRVSGGRIDIGAVERQPTGTLQFSLSNYTVNENGVTATITVTRTDGSEGAVSVDYQTSNGTATQPADYQTAAGTLNWAAGDTASQTFQITIVDDALVEGDETVNLTLSNPQGGAAVGSPATAVLTIVDNDLLLVPTNIPTLGDAGKFLFAGLCGLAALLALRRRKLAAPTLALTLALGSAGAVQAAPLKGREVKEVKAAVVARSQTVGNQWVLQLADGTIVKVPAEGVKLLDRRHGRHGTAGINSLPQGQPVLLEIKHGQDGTVLKIKVELFDSAARAQAIAQGVKQNP